MFSSSFCSLKMSPIKFCNYISSTIVALLLSFASSNAQVVIYVDKSGYGQFSTIQSAINSVPSNNKNWIYINIKEGVYKEQVKIPYDKPFIYLRGQNKEKTMVVWDAHQGIDKSATFISQADNILVRSITFMNSYNYPLGEKKNPLKQAPAAMIEGDKCAFYDCNFVGIQDTLWDVSGRHLFKFCTIQGAVDFIFGNGRSIYEGCTLSVVAESVGVTGFITAQGRGSGNEDTGFVFKDCQIIGRGNTFLGRPWRPYARVIFYNSYMSSIITPQGWDPWRTQQTTTITFVENSCHGPGANSAGRVKWMKNLTKEELELFTSLSFIDDHGWLKTIKF